MIQSNGHLLIKVDNFNKPVFNHFLGFEYLSNKLSANLFYSLQKIKQICR